jgi:hypothetical protein
MFSSAMLGVLAANTNLVLARLWLKSGKLLDVAVSSGHGTTQISHTEPSQHCNITHWTHIEVKCFDTTMLRELAASNLGFGLALEDPGIPRQRFAKLS